MNLLNAVKAVLALLVICSAGLGFAQQKQVDRITYTIVKSPNPTSEQKARYEKYDRMMKEIVQLYNEHARYVKGIKIKVHDAGPTGRAMGGMNQIWMTGESDLWTHMHEVNHALGMAVSWRFRNMIVNRDFYGPAATQLARELSGDPELLLRSDGHAFWPYGINNASDANTLQKRINAVKMMDRIWQDRQDPHMWNTRQIKSADGKQCLSLDRASLTVFSTRCKNTANYAWDFSNVLGTRSHRIKDVLSKGCLAVKPSTNGPTLTVVTCSRAESVDEMWETGTGSQIRSVSQPQMCLVENATTDMGLGLCSAPRTTKDIQLRNGANPGYCMTADTTTPSDNTRYVYIKAQQCVNSVARQVWRLDENLIKFLTGDLCLQAASEQTSVGTELHTWPCDRSKSSPGGRYFQNSQNQLESLDDPGICIGVKSGKLKSDVTLELQYCGKNPSQTWFDHVEIRSGFELNHCMAAEVKGDLVDDQLVSVVLSKCGKFADRQQWRFHTDSLVVGKSGKVCLQSTNNESTDGTTLHTWPCDLVKDGIGGRYFLNDLNQIEMKDVPGMCVAYPPNSRGQRLSLQACNNTSRHQWHMKNG